MEQLLSHDLKRALRQDLDAAATAELQIVEVGKVARHIWRGEAPPRRQGNESCIRCGVVVRDARPIGLARFLATPLGNHGFDLAGAFASAAAAQSAQNSPPNLWGQSLSRAAGSRASCRSQGGSRQGAWFSIRCHRRAAQTLPVEAPPGQSDSAVISRPRRRNSGMAGPWRTHGRDQNHRRWQRNFSTTARCAHHVST